MTEFSMAMAIPKARPSRTFRIDLDSVADAGLPVAVLGVHDLRFELVSPTFANLPVPVPASEGRHLSEVLPDIDLDAVRTVQATGRPVRTAPIALGSRLWCFDLLPPARESEDPGSILVMAHVWPPQDPVGMTEALADTTTALEQSRRQIGEMQHRMKNSLQLVASLLNLQGRTVGGGDAADEFAEAYRRVLTVAAVYDRLYRTQKISSIDFGSYLATLCHDAERVAAMDGRECVISIDTTEVEMPTDRAIALSLIVNELLANALEHAYPDRQPCSIAVGLARLPDHGLELTIRDHGKGLPDDFDLAKRKTLGMKLVTALARQIDGRVAVERQTPGTRFVLCFR